MGCNVIQGLAIYALVALVFCAIAQYIHVTYVLPQHSISAPSVNNYLVQ